MKHITKLTNIKNFLSGGVIFSSVSALWKTFMDPDKIGQNIYYIGCIIFIVLSIIFLFIDHFKKNIKEAKDPESEGGETVTPNEVANAVASSIISVIPLAQELKDLIEKKKNLEDKKAEDKQKLLETGRKVYFKDIQKVDSELVEVNARIGTLENLKSEAMRGLTDGEKVG